MGIRQWKLVFFREVHSLLTLPLYYILAGIFFTLTSIIYLMTLTDFAAGAEEMTVNVTESVVVPTFHTVHFFLLVQIPLLTMRVFSEDQSTGMLDLLQTTPLKDWPLLLGKFSAVALAMGSYILLTLAYPVTTAFLGEVEWPVIIGSIIALLLSSFGYVSVGLFFSSLTESQVVAAVLTYVGLFLFVFAKAIGSSAGIPALSDATEHLSVTNHVQGLLSGNIAPMNIVYFLGLMTVFLFLTARILEARRWRA